MKIVYLHFLCVLIAAAIVFTFPVEVCSGDRATSFCSRDGDVMEWSLGMMRITLLRERSNASSNVLVDGINFSVTLIFLNTTLIISNVSFTATPVADGKVLGCVGGRIGASTATIRVVTDGKPL